MRSMGAVRIIWMTYGLLTDQLQIFITRGIRKTFYRKFKQFDFSMASPRTHHICGGCHKDITDSTDMKNMIRKSFTIFHIW